MLTACGKGGNDSREKSLHYRENSQNSTLFDDDEELRSEIASARAEYESAAYELRSAVEDLRHMPWDLQMSEIRSKMEKMEESLNRLEDLSPNDWTVINARSEFENFQSTMDRLHFENWRYVEPDLDDSSEILESESTSILEDTVEDEKSCETESSEVDINWLYRT